MVWGDEEVVYDSIFVKPVLYDQDYIAVVIKNTNGTITCNDLFILIIVQLLYICSNSWCYSLD